MPPTNAETPPPDLSGNAERARLFETKNAADPASLNAKAAATVEDEKGRTAKEVAVKVGKEKGFTGEALLAFVVGLVSFLRGKMDNSTPVQGRGPLAVPTTTDAVAKNASMSKKPSFEGEAKVPASLRRPDVAAPTSSKPVTVKRVEQAKAPEKKEAVAAKTPEQLHREKLEAKYPGTHVAVVMRQGSNKATFTVTPPDAPVVLLDGYNGKPTATLYRKGTNSLYLSGGFLSGGPGEGQLTPSMLDVDHAVGERFLLVGGTQCIISVIAPPPEEARFTSALPTHILAGRTQKLRISPPNGVVLVGGERLKPGTTLWKGGSIDYNDTTGVILFRPGKTAVAGPFTVKVGGDEERTLALVGENKEARERLGNLLQIIHRVAVALASNKALWEGKDQKEREQCLAKREKINDVVRWAYDLSVYMLNDHPTLTSDQYLTQLREKLDRVDDLLKQADATDPPVLAEAAKSSSDRAQLYMLESYLKDLRVQGLTTQYAESREKPALTQDLTTEVLAVTPRLHGSVSQPKETQEADPFAKVPDTLRQGVLTYIELPPGATYEAMGTDGKYMPNAERGANATFRRTTSFLVVHTIYGKKAGEPIARLKMPGGKKKEIKTAVADSATFRPELIRGFPKTHELGGKTELPVGQAPCIVVKDEQGDWRRVEDGRTIRVEGGLHATLDKSKGCLVVDSNTSFSSVRGSLKGTIRFFGDTEFNSGEYVYEFGFTGVYIKPSLEQLAALRSRLREVYEKKGVAANAEIPREKEKRDDAAHIDNQAAHQLDAKAADLRAKLEFEGRVASAQDREECAQLEKSIRELCARAGVTA